MLNLFLDELLTPTGQQGPLKAAYDRAASGVWHAVLGAVFCGAFGWWGLGPAFAVALVYWLLKETGDLRRGGKFWDGIEDAICVGLGLWYGTGWWPLMICLMGAVIMVSAGARHK